MTKSQSIDFLQNCSRSRALKNSEIRTENAIKIQSLVRGFLARSRWRSEEARALSRFIEQNPNWNELDASVIHLALRGILFKYDASFDPILERVCRLLSGNMLNVSGSPNTWYIGLCLNPKFAANQIVQMRRLIQAVCSSVQRCNMVKHRYFDEFSTEVVGFQNFQIAGIFSGSLHTLYLKNLYLKSYPKLNLKRFTKLIFSKQSNHRKLILVGDFD